MEDKKEREDEREQPDRRESKWVNVRCVYGRQNNHKDTQAVSASVFSLGGGVTGKDRGD